MTAVSTEQAVAPSLEPMSVHVSGGTVADVVRRGLDIVSAGLTLLVLSPVLLGQVTEKFRESVKALAESENRSPSTSSTTRSAKTT